MTTEELQNYIPKGELKGFPKEIIARMLDCQEEQGNPRDISVFEKQRVEGKNKGGFTWDETKEGDSFWSDLLTNKDFNLFFEKYPKKAHQFRVGDEVIDIITRQKGKIFKISAKDNSVFSMYVDFNERKDIYALDGRYYAIDKYPRLLHYRDDYDYSIIDFNNLPKRQMPKRWRAEKGETYYFFTSNFEVEKYYDHNDYNDNKAYDSGNYFRTEVEAEIIAQKLNTYFKQLIQEENEHERNLH